MAVSHQAVQAVQAAHPVFGLLAHLVTNAVLIFVSGCVGYWIKARGIHGIWNDMQDIKKDIQDLKAKVEAHSAQAS